MKRAVLITLLACASLAIAAERFKITFVYPTYIGETQLKPGACRLTLDGEQAIFQQGKRKLEVPVRVETGENQYRQTTVRYRVDGDKYTVSEIRLGGTNRKLIFRSSS